MLQFDTLKKNLKSGITVCLISIPLSISLAVASNATPLIGIITAIWAGIFAAIWGGSQFNIVGPTGALSGIIATYILVNGVNGLPILAIATGICIFIAYIFKLERYLMLIPSSVIHGFTLGVACIIGLNQMNAAIGLQGLPQHERFFQNVIESFRHIPDTSWATLGIFIIFLCGLFLFKKISPKIPGAIILAPVGILLGYMSGIHAIPLAIQTLGGKFGEINFQLFILPRWEFAPAMIQTAMVVALIAILETMLSAKIADGMTHTKHNERKEMLGLALANIASGLAGGMPATAALARTSLNIKTGATDRSSAIVNTICIALISLFFLRYFRYIPMPVIAAILVFVAIQMVEKKHFTKFFRYEKTSFWISLIVAAVTIIEDPIVGILLGVALSLLIFVNRISHGQFDLTLNKFGEGMVGSLSGEKLKEITENADVLLYSIKGKLCYINSRAHIARFETNLSKYTYVILRLREVYFIDFDGVEALDEIIEIVESRGQKIFLTSIDHGIIGLLKTMSKKYKKLKSEGRIFEKTEYALRSLGVETQSKNKIIIKTR